MQFLFFISYQRLQVKMSPIRIWLDQDLILKILGTWNPNNRLGAIVKGSSEV
jgi:hypothetical protein